MAEGGKVAEDLGLSDAALQVIIDGIAAKLQKAGHKDGTPRGNGDPSNVGEGTSRSVATNKGGESELIMCCPARSGCRVGWSAIRVVALAVGAAARVVDRYRTPSTLMGVTICGYSRSE